MRYPVGFRPTWAEAFEAALESSRMTGMRYRASRNRELLGCACHGARRWVFRPAQIPPPQHEGVRV